VLLGVILGFEVCGVVWYVWVGDFDLVLCWVDVYEIIWVKVLVVELLVVGDVFSCYCGDFIWCV